VKGTYTPKENVPPHGSLLRSKDKEERSLSLPILFYYSERKHTLWLIYGALTETKMTKKIQTLKGFRDFLPEKMRVRNYVLGVFRNVFESFGFEPLETPALEYAETLLGKYGEEADRLVYTFEDRGGRKVGLRYDLTVPVSRVLAQYGDKISLPFKRYQIQRAWRAEKPQKGRYREFTQCDIDIFGASAPLADAEIIAVIYEILKKLNFEKFIIKINSRQVLFQMLKNAGIREKDLQLSMLRSIDKLEKIGKSGVERELKRKGFSNKIIKETFKTLKTIGPDENLKQVLEFVREFGVKEKFFKFDPTMVRGLDYYTGPIFETCVEEPKIGSITGGGRFDKLVSQLGGPDIPATGTTIGLDRICDVISELGFLRGKLKSPVRVLVTVFDKNLVKESVKMVTQLRKNKIATLLYSDLVSLDKQLKYADKKGIPFVLIIGPEEAKERLVTVKIMKTREQIKIKNEVVIQKLKEMI